MKNNSGQNASHLSDDGGPEKKVLFYKVLLKDDIQFYDFDLDLVIQKLELFIARLDDCKNGK